MDDHLKESITYEEIATTRKELLSYLNKTRMELHELERKKRYLLLRKATLQNYGHSWGIHFGEAEYSVWEEYESDKQEQEIERRIAEFLKWIRSLLRGDKVLLHYYNGDAQQEYVVLRTSNDTVWLTQGGFSFDKSTGHDFEGGVYITPVWSYS